MSSVDLKNATCQMCTLMPAKLGGCCNENEKAFLEKGRVNLFFDIGEIRLFCYE